mmetsp:Transcript_18432/g.24333  ORF Transcript_18432/g.24333 Transcript_18432/m.24333 type:complete len:1224 (+) Transcript_18432:131-3802(+)
MDQEISELNKKYAGVQFKKDFVGFGQFSGQVQEVWRKNKEGVLARVVYQDGDAEDVPIAELETYVAANPKETKKPGSTKKRKQEGRKSSEGVKSPSGKKSRKSVGKTPVKSPKGKSTTPAADPDQKVEIWDKVNKKKIAASKLPKQKNLEKYLASHPGHIVYSEQDKANKSKSVAASMDSLKEYMSTRVAVWNKDTQKKITGDKAPTRQTLAKFFKSNPNCEVYWNQDKGVQAEAIVKVEESASAQRWLESAKRAVGVLKDLEKSDPNTPGSAAALESLITSFEKAVELGIKEVDDLELQVLRMHKLPDLHVSLKTMMSVYDSMAGGSSADVSSAIDELELGIEPVITAKVSGATNLGEVHSSLHPITIAEYASRQTEFLEESGSAKIVIEENREPASQLKEKCAADQAQTTQKLEGVKEEQNQNETERLKAEKDTAMEVERALNTKNDLALQLEQATREYEVLLKKEERQKRTNNVLRDSEAKSLKRILDKQSKENFALAKSETRISVISSLDSYVQKLPTSEVLQGSMQELAAKLGSMKCQSFFGDALSEAMKDRISKRVAHEVAKIAVKTMRGLMPMDKLESVLNECKMAYESVETDSSVADGMPFSYQSMADSTERIVLKGNLRCRGGPPSFDWKFTGICGMPLTAQAINNSLQGFTVVFNLTDPEMKKKKDSQERVDLANDEVRNMQKALAQVAQNPGTVAYSTANPAFEGYQMQLEVVDIPEQCKLEFPSSFLEALQLAHSADYLNYLARKDQKMAGTQKKAANLSSFSQFEGTKVMCKGKRTVSGCVVSENGAASIRCDDTGELMTVAEFENYAGVTVKKGMADPHGSVLVLMKGEKAWRPLSDIMESFDQEQIQKAILQQKEEKAAAAKAEEEKTAKEAADKAAKEADKAAKEAAETPVAAEPVKMDTSEGVEETKIAEAEEKKVKAQEEEKKEEELPKDAIMNQICDMIVSDGSFEFALKAAGLTCRAVDRVVYGSVLPAVEGAKTNGSNAFCCLRPSGGQVGRRGFSKTGVSLLNNVAIATMHARISWGIQKVAILDINTIFSSGTYEIFKNDHECMFASIFLKPDAVDPVMTNVLNDVSAENKNYLYAILPEGTEGSKIKEPIGSKGIKQVISNELTAMLREFQPQMILLSSAFDGFEQHPLGGAMGLSPREYNWISRQISQLADQLCDGRFITVLEDGVGLVSSKSDQAKFSKSVLGHLQGLMGKGYSSAA